MSTGNDRELEAAPPADDLGDLFDYDVPLDDILQDVPAQTGANTQKRSNAADGTGLGLDEEVKVTKTRQPIAKLDENRLLSQQGIPKLRRVAKSKLKFKGKGHEFSDAARLLNFYQLWLDDLFPRAKFADGLSMIEKLGRSRRMQTMRKQWIDEERPVSSADDSPNAPPDGQGIQSGRGEPVAYSNNDNGIDSGRQQPPDGDPLSANGPSRLSEDRSMPRQQTQRDDEDQGLFIPDETNSNENAMEDVPGHDELDDLLREQEDALGLT